MNSVSTALATPHSSYTDDATLRLPLVTAPVIGLAVGSLLRLP